MVRKSKLQHFLAAVAAAVVAAPAAATGPVPLVQSPAVAGVHPRVEAALFSITLTLRQGSSLSGLLLDSGVDQGDAALAASAAEGHVDTGVPCRVKLALSRDSDNGAVHIERLVLSSASAQTIIERRQDALKVISSALAKQRIA